ncbi:porin [Pseudorhodoferax soli]|uniref:Putative porin n=1 Tax=Pseudorhodoferax soli TaxID=545864 RepID=A0A368XLB7_9BURK|nr:porin [Pseudorhodoferax soli]RCW68763.1 putative porin [Pseudorhodoferax soli]
MNKTAGAVFALAAWGGACAQSSVTLYGTADLYLSRDSSGGHTTTGLKDGGHTASRIGFRGTEDLGGGLEAHFLLEAGYNPETGAGTLPGPSLAFSRQAFVGLSGAWGQLDAGRMYTPMFYTLFKADPYGVNAVFSPLNLVSATDAQPGITAFAARASGMLRYRTPVASPFVADIAYAPGKAATSSRRSGEFKGAAFGWQRKPWYVGYAFQRVRSGSAAAPVAVPAVTTYHALSASYQFTDLALYAHGMRTTARLPGVPDAVLFALGASYPVTPVSTLIVEAIRRKVDGSARAQVAWTLGYDHHLSKRTALYARWLGLDNRSGASATLAGVPVVADSGDGVRVLAAGIRHTF